MEVFTIGFTQTTAAEFFGKLKKYGIRVAGINLANGQAIRPIRHNGDLQYRDLTGRGGISRP